MNTNNDSHTKSMPIGNERLDSICDTPTGFISVRRKRKLPVNTSNDINNTPTQNYESKLPTQKKQTKKKTKMKDNKVTTTKCTITETSNNVSMRRDETSKKPKLYSSKDESELLKQNEVEYINCESNNVGDMDTAFDRLKMKSPYLEENVYSDYNMKLRSHRAKVFNFSSDTDEDNNNLNNSTFANRIRQKSSSISMKKSSVKKPKAITKKIRPNKKSPQRKCNNPLIDERVRKSQMEVLDTSITYKDNDELIEPDPKPHHIYPEVTIVCPTTELNNSHTSITSLNIEIEEPNVNSRPSDNFLTNFKNTFKTNDNITTYNKIQTNIVTLPHEVVEICEVEQQQSVQDEHYEPQIDCYEVTSSPKKHNENKLNEQKSVDINFTASKSHDEIVELNDCTSSRYFQSKKSRPQKSKKGNTKQKNASKIQKKHNSVQDMAQVNILNDRSSGDFQTKKPTTKLERVKIRDTQQQTKESKGNKANVDVPQTSKYFEDADDVTTVQLIETHNSPEKSNRSKQNPIPESNENTTTDNLNWNTFLDHDQCINTNGQQPSRSRNTSTPNISFTQSQESQRKTHSMQEQPSTSNLKNYNVSSQSLLIESSLLQSCHIGYAETELNAQSSIYNKASKRKMLNISEHSRTEEQNESIIQLLKDIKKQNEKFLADVEKDTESFLDLLLVYNKKIFKEYIDECEKQKNTIIANLKTNLRISLNENNESFKKVEDLFKK